MKITRVQIKRVEGQEKLRALVGVTLDNFIILYDITIMEINGKTMVFLPFKLKDNERIYLYSPKGDSFTNYFYNTIMEVYNSGKDEVVFDSDNNKHIAHLSLEEYNESHPWESYFRMVLNDEFEFRFMSIIKDLSTNQLKLVFPQIKRFSTVREECRLLVKDDEFINTILDSYAELMNNANLKTIKHDKKDFQITIPKKWENWNMNIIEKAVLKLSASKNDYNEVVFSFKTGKTNGLIYITIIENYDFSIDNYLRIREERLKKEEKELLKSDIMYNGEKMICCAEKGIGGLFYKVECVFVKDNDFCHAVWNVNKDELSDKDLWNYVRTSDEIKAIASIRKANA